MLLQAMLMPVPKGFPVPRVTAPKMVSTIAVRMLPRNHVEERVLSERIFLSQLWMRCSHGSTRTYLTRMPPLAPNMQLIIAFPSAFSPCFRTSHDNQNPPILPFYNFPLMQLPAQLS